MIKRRKMNKKDMRKRLTELSRHYNRHFSASIGQPSLSLRLSTKSIRIQILESP
jgi:hypothetical protein